MTTDYRALCAELVETLSKYQERLEETYHPDRPEAEELDAGFRVLERARAALAQPEFNPATQALADLVWPDPTTITPCGMAINGRMYRLTPMDEQPPIDPPSWCETDSEQRAWHAGWTDRDNAMWPKPIPVSERLPGAEDCDAEGMCWVFAPGRQSEPKVTCSWLLTPAENIKAIARVCTEEGDFGLIEEICPFWLPAHALPFPTP